MSELAPETTGGVHPRNAIVALINRVTGAFNALGSLATFALMLLVCADVAGRYLFNSPVVGVTEIVEISIVAIVFAQLADTTANDRITRADSVVGMLREKRPKVARTIDFLAALAGVILMAILAYGIIPAIFKDYERGYYIGTAGLFTFPTWPTKVIIAIGVFLTGIQLVIAAIRAMFGDLRGASATQV